MVPEPAAGVAACRAAGGANRGASARVEAGGGSAMTTPLAPCPRCSGELPAGARYCPACGARVGAAPRLLVRRRAGQQLAGVCAGLAEYFDLDRSLVRVVYAVATVFTGVLPGVVLYVALALVVPAD